MFMGKCCLLGILILIILPSWSDAYTLEILHLNDTHSNLIARGLKITPLAEGDEYRVPAGSAARNATGLIEYRNSGENVIFLHAGDLVQGTLFYTLYGGIADAAVYNLMPPDAMVTGNHEFDRGSRGLALLLDRLEFPVICSNLDVSEDSLLAGRIPPCIELERGGERIGIIGLVTEELHTISSPSPETLVLPLVETAQSYIDSLQGEGIDKIIILSHIGYEHDLDLASNLSGADVIVGGHSHTLLGDFSSLGLNTQGRYPTEVTGADGGTTLVVQAWCYGKVLGRLQVEFDDDGRVTGHSGTPAILTDEPFTSASGDTLWGPDLDSFLEAVFTDPRIAVVQKDEAVEDTVAYYNVGIAELEQQVIGTAQVDLPHVRVPDADLPGGSMIAPIVCDAILWKTREIGMNADIALQNAGGVRITIPQGEITVGTVYRLLPFSNTLAVLEISGRDFRTMLENTLADIFDSGMSDGAFPYLAGAEYRAQKCAPAGSRIQSLNTISGDGTLTPVDPDSTYVLVTNSYVASGGDGYSILSGIPFTDTGFTDSEVFTEYVEMLGVVKPDSQRVFLQPDFQ